MEIVGTCSGFGLDTLKTVRSKEAKKLSKAGCAFMKEQQQNNY